MLLGVGGVGYILQAIERTILWPEARAVKAANTAMVAKFIYEDIVCRFSWLLPSMEDWSSRAKSFIFCKRYTIVR